MSNIYAILLNRRFVNANELYHYGIKGMKWGIHRYQNPDGSFTPVGKKRLEKADYKWAKKKTDKITTQVKKKLLRGSLMNTAMNSFNFRMLFDQMANSVLR